MERVGGVNRYPFVAVVGQSRLKLALLLLAIDPRIGGLLVIGEKGSAKSTLARGVADLLETGAPFVELPVGATEDRVIGTLDLAGVINNRSEELKPGLLIQANSGVLYVDEVNLLQDHIVDLMLDAAASGTVRIEREGFSMVKDSRFVLCGSMNPEEGELRPQLLDRFGFAIEVDALENVEERAEAVTRRVEYEADPELFILNYKDETDALREKVEAARRLVNFEGRPRKNLFELAKFAAQVSIAHGVEGLRSDLALVRGAIAYAALAGRSQATEEDLIEVSSLALLHRSRQKMKDHTPGEDKSTHTDGRSSERNYPSNESSREEAASRFPQQDSGASSVSEDEMGGSTLPNRTPEQSSGDASGGQYRIDAPAPPNPGEPQLGQGDGKTSADKGDQFPKEPDFDRTYSETDISKILPTTGHLLVSGSGNRPAVAAPGFDRVKRGGSPLAVRETITNGLRRPADWKLNSDQIEIDLDSSDLVFKRLLLLDERCVVFVVDTSGSMGSIKRVDAAKATIGKLLGDAYLKRHSVAMITFQGSAAETILMPTRSIEIANSRLSQIKRGGKTPLHLGLRKAVELAKRLRAKGTEPFVVVMTDGLVSTSQPGVDPAKATFDASRDLAEAKVDGLLVDFDLTDPKVGIAVEVAKLAKLSYISG